MKNTARFEALLSGRTGRRAYAGWGFGLMALKFTLDRVVVQSMGGSFWNWFSYWQPIEAWRPSAAGGLPAYAIPLLVLAVPFIAIGVILTLRRLRDVGWPLWLVTLFFVPVLNLVMFTLLCLLPARDEPRVRLGIERGVLAWLARVLAMRSPALSAVLAMLLTAAMIAPLTWLATAFFRNYGWGVFVALPFLLGMTAAVIHAAPQPRTFGQCVGVALLALLFCGTVILAVAIEGLVCLLMAAPLAAPIVILGATAGYYLQLGRWNRAIDAGRVYAIGWIVLPLVFAVENQMQFESPMIAATTSIEIAASPEVVWHQVVAFSELPPPTEWVFRSGIAYPVRATISGRGVGAVRRCEFSTGAFVEPITMWDEGRKLAFDVIEQPHPMRELSPYRSLHPAHLEGFFRSRRGEFLLITLPDGRTRLDGTTWYTQKFWPARYWQGWSDYLVHTIHTRVLQHIRHEAEQGASRAFSSKP